MFTLGFEFKPWTRREGDRRRADDHGLPARDRRRERHRQAHPLRPQGGLGADWSSADGRWTVDVEHAETARRSQITAELAVRRQRLLQLRRGLHAGVPRPRGLRRADRAPAALAGGSRLRRQEGRRHRQRRHRGHADSGAGRLRRGARDDAAALADLRRRCPTSTRSPNTANKAARRQARLRAQPVEEHRASSARRTSFARRFPDADAQA